MLRVFTVLSVMGLVWGMSSGPAAAQHERYYEFEGTHVALSIERFMGIDYVDFEGPPSGDVHARFLLNADEYVPTSYARFGFDVFIHRLSVGLAGGVTGDENAILAPRVGYLIGITPQIGIWLRGGAFFATTPGPNYFGITGEAFFAYFPYSRIALHLGPTIDLAFANRNFPNYVALGLPEFGMTVFL